MNRSDKIRAVSGLVLSLTACFLPFCEARCAKPQAAPRRVPITVVLPPRIVAGERGTLAVLDDDGQLVADATVEIQDSGEIRTDNTGRGTFLAPHEPGTMVAHLANQVPFTATVIPAPEQSIHTPNGSLASAVVVPKIVALGDRLRIECSSIRGDATLDRVFLGGQPALVLASSSVALVALPNPEMLLGKAELRVEAGGVTLIRTPVTVVALSVTGPTKPLAPGKRGALTIEASGTVESIMVDVQNLSPDVVGTEQGAVAHVRTSGGRSNVAKVALMGIKAGDYELSAHVADTSTTSQ